jgi:uncharacterized membrane protein
MFNAIKKNIVSGVITIIPLGVTIWFGVFIYSTLTGWGVSLAKSYFPEVFKQGVWVDFTLRFCAISIILILLFAIGLFARYTIGLKLIELTDKIMRKLPMLSTIYTTARQIWDAIWTIKGGMFNQVVMFEYPRKGIWVIGFLTNENDNPEWEVSTKSDQELYSIFLPTTPNPTSGFLLFIPKEDCVLLDMDVADGMKLVISGGAVAKN